MFWKKKKPKRKQPVKKQIPKHIGMKPSDDPRADELRNKNLSAPSESEPEINPPVEDKNVETE